MKTESEHTDLISVIIPTYNRATRLEQAIQSVLGQTHRHFELIVVDDGSTDATAGVVSRYPEVRYLDYPENKGVSYARNRGVEAASGNWLAFLDSDDQWLPEKLERQWQAVNQGNGVVACYTDEIWVRRGVRVNAAHKHRKFSGKIFRNCLPLCIISPSSILMQRQVWDHLGGFDESLPACEDYDMWLRLCLYYEVLFIEERLIIKFGGHADQLSQRYWGMDRFRVRALEKILEDPALSGEQELWVLEMLAEKYRILKTGFLKRDKQQEAERYAGLENKYRTRLMTGLPSVTADPMTGKGI